MRPNNETVSDRCGRLWDCGWRVCDSSAIVSCRTVVGLQVWQWELSRRITAMRSCA